VADLYAICRRHLSQISEALWQLWIADLWVITNTVG